MAQPGRLPRVAPISLAGSWVGGGGPEEVEGDWNANLAFHHDRAHVGVCLSGQPGSKGIKCGQLREEGRTDGVKITSAGEMG